MNNLLYIGLNGYAGSGKDTVAKMMKVILENDTMDLEECKRWYFDHHTNPTQSATFNFDNKENSKVLCIAYADQLKQICSNIFGIPLQRFYMNKSNAWICINDKFQYTEIKPNENNIITSEDFSLDLMNYRNPEDEKDKVWMSLREILVYVGTYVLQSSINQSIFVNIVRNKINEEQKHNPNLKYVIVTDNRFNHELQYIKENNGITITISRNSIKQLDNIAEHDLDDIEDYNYTIDNSFGYSELFDNIWNLIHDNLEFSNKTLTLNDRENVGNYLRLKYTVGDIDTWQLCTSMPIQQLYKSNNEITAINPIGGPILCVGERIDNIDIDLIPLSILFDDNSGYFYMTSKHIDN